MITSPPTVHFVYPTGQSKAAPMCITNQLTPRIQARYPVKVYDWLSTDVIVPREGDILLGHPHPHPSTVFQASFENPLFSKRLVMSPLAHAMPEYIAFLDPFIASCDAYLAITAKHWIRTLPTSAVSHWEDKIIHLDLAVDRTDYPRIKATFNPPGKRKFLYIGSCGRNKGSDLIAALADNNPELEISWIGSGEMPGRSVKKLGAHTLTSPSARELIASHDFLLHMGRSDANPTTVLEALAWGLIPMCTPQSGYEDEPWLIAVSQDIEVTSRILIDMCNAPEALLLSVQKETEGPLRSHFTWDRFASEVLRALDAESARQVRTEHRALFEVRAGKLRTLAKKKRAHDAVISTWHRCRQRLKRMSGICL